MKRTFKKINHQSINHNIHLQFQLQHHLVPFPPQQISLHLHLHLSQQPVLNNPPQLLAHNQHHHLPQQTTHNNLPQQIFLLPRLFQQTVLNNHVHHLHLWYQTAHHLHLSQQTVHNNLNLPQHLVHHHHLQCHLAHNNLPQLIALHLHPWYQTVPLNHP